jgi:hypothetical protein
MSREERSKAILKEWNGLSTAEKQPFFSREQARRRRREDAVNKRAREEEDDKPSSSKSSEVCTARLALFLTVRSLIWPRLSSRRTRVQRSLRARLHVSAAHAGRAV